jgi:hypothetical protein
MNEIEALRCKRQARNQGESLRLDYRLAIEKKMQT